MVSATWTPLPLSLPRSSHSLSLINRTAYIWGGELQPRQPVDTDMHAVTLDGHYERIAAADAPSPRVAHAAAAVNGKIYLFGGRGGPDMAPLDESGRVHVFDPATSTWSSILPAGDVPAPRSYHAATAAGTAFVIHGGCPAAGRLADTWSFDTTSHKWSQLGTAPGAGRGGSAIAAKDGKIWRFGGFDGTSEAGGAIDSLDGGEWTSTPFDLGPDAPVLGAPGGPEGPGPRSVAGLHATPAGLVLLYGEGKPSNNGHEAAGTFWDDVWVYDGKWREVHVGEKPKARGWFASDAADGVVVMQGGLDGGNARLGDLWVLRLG